MRFKVNILIETKFGTMNDRNYEELKTVYIDTANEAEALATILDEFQSVKIVSIDKA